VPIRPPHRRSSANAAGRIRTRDARPPAGVPRAFLAVDVETTGFSPSEDRVLEVAMVRFEDGRVTDELALRVDPCRRIPRVVSSLTGINAADVRGQPRFLSIAPRVHQALATACCVVAYNAPFDRRFLAAELARARLSLPARPWVDVLAIARAIEPRARSFSLAAACARHGLEPFDAHRAAADARAAGELLVALAHKTSPRALERFIPKKAFQEPAAALSARLKARVLSLFD
jgi:DNA polymerase III epsilon subunit-like protein